MKRTLFICKKITENIQLKAVYLKYVNVDICQGYFPHVPQI